MSKFVYTPEGAEPRKWDFEFERLDNDTAELIEETYGKPYGAWVMDASAFSMRAMHVLLWVMLRQDAPDLDYDAVKFRFNEITMELDDEESDELKADLEDREQAGEDLTENEQIALKQLREGAVVPKEDSAQEAADFFASATSG